MWTNFRFVRWQNTTTGAHLVLVVLAGAAAHAFCCQCGLIFNVFSGRTPPLGLTWYSSCLLAMPGGSTGGWPTTSCLLLLLLAGAAGASLV
jgi:hypothetical protein